MDNEGRINISEKVEKIKDFIKYRFKQSALSILQSNESVTFLDLFPMRKV